MARIELWKDKPNRIIEPTLFSDKAEKFAEDLNRAGQRVNKRTQIRKFYDEVLRLDSDSQRLPEQWDHILPRLHMLIAKAAYAKGRDLVSEDFVNFIKSAVNDIHAPEDLAVFANFFEALMGFYRLLRPAN
jgi:CRISPR-associated protein Csm2